jgi:hypothetical protein
MRAMSFVVAQRLNQQLSAGRVVAGIGQGWMPEEFTRRPALQIPRSRIGPKPVQDPLPVLIDRHYSG